MGAIRPKFEQYQDYLGRVLTAKSQIEGGLPPSKTPKTITFQVTETCNLACTYCYQINKSSKAMSFETAKKFIDLLFEESYREGSYVYTEDTPGVVLEFIGGEPLLEIELIDQITDYFRFKCISLNHVWTTRHIVSMISNGVSYFDDRVMKYFEKNKGNVSFSISLDGCKELHDMCRIFPTGEGSYDKAEKACMHYKENFNDAMLTKMTIAPENIDWTYTAFLNLLSLGYKDIHSNVVYEKGWDLSHAKIFYDELIKIADHLLNNNLEGEVFTSLFEEDMFVQQTERDNQNYCGSTGCMIACNPQGNIYPCLRFMESSLGDKVEPFTIGNIHTGIGQEECHKKRIGCLDAVTRKSQSTQECFDCPIGAGCGWCTAYNYQETGSIDKRVTYICDMHKARSLANVYYWNSVYRKLGMKKQFDLNCPKEWALEIISEEEYKMLEDLARPHQETLGQSI